MRPARPSVAASGTRPAPPVAGNPSQTRPRRLSDCAKSNTVRSQRLAIKIGAHALAWARRYRSAAPAADVPTALPGSVTRVAAQEPWLAPLAGSDLRCDARIIANVEYILATFGLRATSCFRTDNSAALGEHPLGLALDAVPVDGDWSRALRAAEAFGWNPACPVQLGRAARR